MISNFLSYSPLPELMQGAGVAALTLLISFAIGIIIHHLGDGERKQNDLDLHVAFDYVWLFKPFLIVLAILVLSPFFMAFDNIWIRSIAFVIWVISLIHIFQIIFKLYNWVKGDKDTPRLKYLSKFRKTPRDQMVPWRDYWKTKGSSENRFNEKDFFVAFSNQVDEILQTDQHKGWDILPKLLEDFYTNIGNRNKIFILVFSEFFPKILEWDFIIWKKQYSKFEKGKSEAETKADVKVFEIENVISQIIDYVTKEALSGTTGNSYSYFKSLENHITKHEKDHIVGDKHTYHYIESLNIYDQCFNLIPKSQEAYDIWGHYFPSSWKITTDNLKNNLISQVWWHRFYEWSRTRIWNENKEWDEDLDEVSKEMFPGVDPILWAKIIVFVMRPWLNDERMKTTVEKKPNFGYVGRIFSGWGNGVQEDLYKQQTAQQKNTIDMTVFLFGGVFSLENIKKWLEELGGLEYPSDSDENRRKLQWEEFLLVIKTRIDEKNKIKLK